MDKKQQVSIEYINELWSQYQSDKSPDIRSKLIELYLPLVKIVAGRLAIGLPQHVDKNDFISEGFFGLLTAINRYDSQRGVKFETYAVARIRGAILDAIRVNDWIPASVRQKAKQYAQAVTQLENMLGRTATDHEIAEKLMITIPELHALLSQLNATTIVPLEDYMEISEAPSRMADPLSYVEDKDVNNILAVAIDKLQEKERMVISLYYYEGLTLKEISILLKLSEARISQLHTKAIYRMRGALSRQKVNLF